MDIETEIERYYAADFLLDVVMATEVEYLALKDEVQGWSDNPNTCEHPPLTKAGRHNRNYPCDICENYMQSQISKMGSLWNDWNASWQVLNDFENGSGESE